MAKLGWIGSVALAAGASAGVAAAQFGLGYGLGVISWSPAVATGPDTPDSVWLSSLSWTTWIAATATVVGAICADRRSAGEIGSAPPRSDAGEQSVFATAIWRVLLAVSAAFGAMLSVALVLVPASAAIRTDTGTPQLIAAGYAVVGILVGIIVAMFALVLRAGAINVIVSSVWIWVLAIAAVIDGVIVGRGLGTAPLDVWPTAAGSPTWSLPLILLGVGVAFLIGIGSAWLALRRGSGPISAGVAGIFGPFIVVIAYLLTVPNLVGINDVDARVSAFILAPYVLIAGTLGSALMSTLWTARLNALKSPVTTQRIASSPKKAPYVLTEPVDPFAAPRPRGSAAVPAQKGAPKTTLADEPTQPLAVPAPSGTGDAAVPAPATLPSPSPKAPGARRSRH